MKNKAIHTAIRRAKASVHLCLTTLIVLILLISLWEWNLLSWIIAAFLFFEMISTRREVNIVEHLVEGGTRTEKKVSEEEKKSSCGFMQVEVEGDRFYSKQYRSSDGRNITVEIIPESYPESVQYSEACYKNADSFFSKLDAFIQEAASNENVTCLRVDSVIVVFADRKNPGIAEIQVKETPEGRVLSCAYDGTIFYNLSLN